MSSVDVVVATLSSMDKDAINALVDTHTEQEISQVIDTIGQRNIVDAVCVSNSAETSRKVFNAFIVKGQQDAEARAQVDGTSAECHNIIEEMQRSNHVTNPELVTRVLSFIENNLQEMQVRMRALEDAEVSMNDLDPDTRHKETMVGVYHVLHEQLSEQRKNIATMQTARDLCMRCIVSSMKPENMSE